MTLNWEKLALRFDGVEAPLAPPVSMLFDDRGSVPADVAARLIALHGGAWGPAEQEILWAELLREREVQLELRQRLARDLFPDPRQREQVLRTGRGTSSRSLPALQAKVGERAREYSREQVGSGVGFI